MALFLDSNNTAPKVSFNTSKLQQGLSVNLSKSNPHLLRAAVKVSWIGDDLDISAVGKGADGKALLNPVEVKYKGRTEVVPRELIFYQNLEQQGIKHGGDLVSSGDEETEAINLATSDVSSAVDAFDFILTSHVEGSIPLKFKDVKNIRADLVDLDTNEILYTTDLNGNDIADQTGVIFATIYREGNDWSYKTMTQGIGNQPAGVQNILNHYYS